MPRQRIVDIIERMYHEFEKRLRLTTQSIWAESYRMKALTPTCKILNKKLIFMNEMEYLPLYRLSAAVVIFSSY